MPSLLSSYMGFSNIFGCRWGVQWLGETWGELKMPCYPVQVQVKLSLKTASSLWVDALSEEVDAPSQPADTAPISLAQVLALLKRK